MPFEKGREKTGGRAPGVKNKTTLALREYARQYTEEAITGLVEIARNGRMPAAARVSAWNIVLDRAWGRPPQAIVGEDGEGPLIIKVER